MNTLDPNYARRFGAIAAAILAAAFAANVVANGARSETRGLEARPEKARQALDLARELGIKGNPMAEGFRVEAAFRLKGPPGKPVSGRYTLEWQSPESWNEEISYPGYSRIRQAREGWVEQVSSDSRQPARVFDLDELLNFVPKPDLILPDEDMDVGIGVRVASEPGTPTPEAVNPPWPFRDGGRGAEVSFRTDLRNQFSLKKSFRYRDRQAFRGHFLPRDLEYRQRGHVVIKARIEELTELDGPLPSPLSAEQETTRFPVLCESLAPAEVIRFSHIPNPESDELFAAKMIVGIDGRVHDLVVMRSAGPDLDRHYKNYLRQQEWRAASCDGVPLDSPVLFTSQERFAFRIGHSP